MSAAGLIDLLRREMVKTLKNEITGLELGTVTAPFPDVAIKIDHVKVELRKQDILVSERLTKNARTVSLKSQPGEQRDLGDSRAADTNSFGRPVDFSHVQLSFEEVLKPGDRVLVQAVSGGQKYIIIDRVVQYD